jgi:hypothetical protein
MVISEIVEGSIQCQRRWSYRRPSIFGRHMMRHGLIHLSTFLDVATAQGDVSMLHGPSIEGGALSQSLLNGM